jgi:DNA-binding LacI/PurR family transcriptional regulator
MRGRTFTIGLMLPHIRNPFFADILDGLTAHLANTDYQAFMIQGGATREVERRAVDALVDRQVDGIIMVAPLASKARLEEVAREKPVVVLARHEKSSYYDSVFADDEAGAELAARLVRTLTGTRAGTAEAPSPGLVVLPRGQHAELVAVGVGHDHPIDLALADVDARRSEGDETVDLGLLITVRGRGDVEM